MKVSTLSWNNFLYHIKSSKHPPPPKKRRKIWLSCPLIVQGLEKSGSMIVSQHAMQRALSQESIYLTSSVICNMRRVLSRDWK